MKMRVFVTKRVSPSAVLKKLLVCSFLIGGSWAQAKEIVHVRLSIPLSEAEPQLKDYYISTDGLSLKPNQVVKAVRKMNVQSAANKTIGEIEVEIGQLKVIHVTDKVVVAREYKLFSRETTPLTEAMGFMIGDTIDTKDSFSDKSSSRKPNSFDDRLAETPLAPEQQSPLADSAAVTPGLEEPALIKPLPGVH